MADIGEKLSELLSSPGGMEKLQQAAGQLQGILGDDGDIGALFSKLTPPEKPTPQKTEGIDLSLLTKAAPLLQAMQQEDDSSNLLKALRPYMHGERQKKLDDAIQMLKWFRLVTLLKDQGVL
jgi:hypothetical protein